MAHHDDQSQWRGLVGPVDAVYGILRHTATVCGEHGGACGVEVMGRVEERGGGGFGAADWCLVSRWLFVCVDVRWRLRSRSDGVTY